MCWNGAKPRFEFGRYSKRRGVTFVLTLPRAQLGFVTGLMISCTPISALAQNAPPVITKQPVSLSVSLGEKVTLTASASSSDPFTFQWQREQVELPNATNSILSLINVQLAQAGSYRAVVANAFGSTTSHVALVNIDPTFRKITSGPIVAGTGASGGAWGDFNNDGLLDLFVSFSNGASSVLYTNAGNGTLVMDSTAGIGSGTGSSWGCAWGDYDNDGHLDLMGSVYGAGNNYVFHNQGNGTFTKLTADPIVGGGGTGNNVIWGDYDNDGYLDAFFAGSQNRLFHNHGDGSFTREINSVAAKDGSGQGCSWGDYDGDGFLDLFVTRVNQPNLLYHNHRDGTFNRMTNAPFSIDVAISQGCTWGDYDNDGKLDLFVCNNNSRNFLYHNEGNGAFSKITNGVIASLVANSSSCTWGDYDNDGFLDLFIGVRGGMNLLFHNQGDGTFDRVTTGSLVNENDTWVGAAWGDLNNDGFPDLFIANLQGKNALYLNSGNTNQWLTIQCEGRVSNRAAIGTKVRVKATIHGKEMWQMREISGGGGLASQNDLRAQFGLGDATNVDIVRVEWPSGIVQELDNVAPKQFLTIKEPPKIKVERLPSGAGIYLTIVGGRGLVYSLECSADFKNWFHTSMLTNQTDALTWTNQPPFQERSRFFRAREL